MRWLVLAPCLAATGCNWVFGLDATIAVDAPVSELPPNERTKLVWAIATTDGMPPAPAIDSMIAYVPIGSESARPQPPMVQVGDDSGLMPATYDVSDGTFEIPFTLRDSPHRVVYTLPGESVPHEWQWSVTNAIITVPRTTRANAPAAPTNAGYQMTPSGLPGQLVAPVLATSGAFSYSLLNPGVDSQQSGATISYRYAQYAQPVAGPLGAPETAKGDWVLLGEFASQTAARSALSGWALTQIDLAANVLSPPASEPAWTTTQRSMSSIACMSMSPDCLPQANATQAQQRLTNALGATAFTQHLSYGVSPSTDLPGFLPGVAPTFIDRPLILSFVESNILESGFMFADPSPSLALERVLAARISTARTVSGVALTSSLQTITNKFSGSIAFPAPLATNVTLGTTNLSGASDAVAFPASSGVVRLQFETEASYSADDFAITLYELTASGLSPVRVYHVIAPEVKIDANLLASGHHYALGITARNGLPGADRGDYGKAQYPFGATTTFPRTFVVQ